MLSSIVYQGVAGGLGAEAVEQAGGIATAGLTPTLTVILDVPPDLGLKRSQSARSHDRMERKGAEYHQKVRDGFLEYAKQHPDRVKVVDASQSIEDVEAEVWEHVRHVLG